VAYFTRYYTVYFRPLETTQTEHPSGGYGFGAYDRQKRRREDELDELARQIALFEAHLAIEPDNVSRETIDPDLLRIRTRVESMQASRLPNRARRAVEYARHVQTKESFLLAERALRQLEEQEELAVLLTLALD